MAEQDDNISATTLVTKCSHLNNFGTHIYVYIHPYSFIIISSCKIKIYVRNEILMRAFDIYD